MTRRVKRIIAVLAGAAVVAIAAWIFLAMPRGQGGDQQVEPPARVRTAIVQTQPIEQSLTLTGEIIPAQRAFEIGLVSKVVSPDGLMQAAEKIATTIASMAPLAIKAAIEAINATYIGLEYGQMLEAELFGAICATQDAKEGTGAFLEKRKAEFKGK